MEIFVASPSISPGVLKSRTLWAYLHGGPPHSGANDGQPRCHRFKDSVRVTFVEGRQYENIHGEQLLMHALYVTTKVDCTADFQIARKTFQLTFEPPASPDFQNGMHSFDLRYFAPSLEQNVEHLLLV